MQCQVMLLKAMQVTERCTCLSMRLGAVSAPRRVVVSATKASMPRLLLKGTTSNVLTCMDPMARVIAATQ